MKARFVFDQTNGDVTKDYYKHLDSLGHHGQLATALFRANKRSCAAKRYRGRGSKQAAYEIKNWSLSEICRILTANDMPWKVALGLVFIPPTDWLDPTFPANTMVRG